MSSSYFHKYQMYFSKVNVSVLPHCQRVYPNTHCSGNDKSKGSQWVLSDATPCSYFQAEGPLELGEVLFHQAKNILWSNLSAKSSLIIVISLTIHDQNLRVEF